MCLGEWQRDKLMIRVGGTVALLPDGLVRWKGG